MAAGWLESPFELLAGELHGGRRRPAGVEPDVLPDKGVAAAAPRSDAATSLEPALVRGRFLEAENAKLRERLRFLGQPAPPPADLALEVQNIDPPARAVQLARQLLSSRYPGVAEAAACLMRAETANAAEAASAAFSRCSLLSPRQGSSEAARLARARMATGLADSAGSTPLARALRERTNFLRDLRLAHVVQAEIDNLRIKLEKKVAEVEEARSEGQGLRKTRQGRAPEVPAPRDVADMRAELQAKRDLTAELQSTLERMDDWPRQFARLEAFQEIIGRHSPKALAREALKRWNELIYWSTNRDPVTYKYPAGQRADELYPASRLVVGFLQVEVKSCQGLQDKGFGILGKANTYVRARVGDGSERTPTVANSLDPVWTGHGSFTFRVQAEDYLLSVEVFSEGTIQDDSLGSVDCFFRLLEPDVWHDVAEELNDGTLRKCGGANFRVRFSAIAPDASPIRATGSDDHGSANVNGGLFSRLQGLVPGGAAASEAADEEWNVYEEDGHDVDARTAEASSILENERLRQAALKPRSAPPGAFKAAGSSKDRKNRSKDKKKERQGLAEAQAADGVETAP